MKEEGSAISGMLLRVLLGVFFIADGLVHVAIWAPQYDPQKAPFDASHSWLLGDQQPLARVLAFAAAAILIVAGIALLAWPTLRVLEAVPHLIPLAGSSA